MAIPVGDILRAFVNPNSWFGRILAKLKGAKITTPGGTEILLDKDQRGDVYGGATPPRTGLDRPAPFNPPDLTGGRRRGGFVVVFLAFLLACDTASGPTSPQAEPTPTPAPVAAPAATPAPAAPVAGRTVVIDEGGGIEIKTPESFNYKACVYRVEKGIQRLSHESERRTAPVGASSSRVPVPACRFQIDVIDWRECPLTGNPPVFGGGLIQGFLSGGDFCPTECIEGTPKVEVKVERSEWGDCKKIDGVWLKARTVKTTTTTSYSCKPPKVEVDERTEWERCTPPCTDTFIGKVTVKADTHTAGTFLYEVRDGTTVIWSASLARGTVAPPFEVALTGRLLKLYVRTSTSPVRWEQDTPPIKAACSETSASWNEAFALSCEKVCR